MSEGGAIWEIRSLLNHSTDPFIVVFHMGPTDPQAGCRAGLIMQLSESQK